MSENLKQVSEVIIVEGRYDKGAVQSAVAATVFETSGFGIFSNKEKLALFRKLAEKRGLIILTDSDRAGFFIRGRLSGMMDDNINVKHAYIPDIKGREKRKAMCSKDGKLGVEAMSADIIITALERAGATFSHTLELQNNETPITAGDLFDNGLSGGKNSMKKRRELLRRLDLPMGLSSKKLLVVLNILFTRSEFLLFFTAAD